VIPAKSAMQTVSASLQKLSDRNGLLYIPRDHAEPLFVLLHKAGGSVFGSAATFPQRGA
jgi:hypothetical protein